MTWESDLAAFWRAADDSDPPGFRRRLDEILLSCPHNQEARMSFEQASAEDFLGDENAAVPLYEVALEGELDADTEQRARIQLASSMRNIGRPSDALDVLNAADFDLEYASARNAFLALIHWDLGAQARSLQYALQAADPGLGRYRRAVGNYANELTDTALP